MDEIESLTAEEFQKQDGYQTPGIERRLIFSSDNVVEGATFHMVWAKTMGGTVSGWHHHGNNHLFAYVLQGETLLEYGPNGEKETYIEPGGAVHVPPEVVHRDINPNEDVDKVAIAFIIGTGEPRVNLDGPE